MQRIFNIFFGAIALSGLLAVSCDKEETTIVVADVPALTVTASLTASAEGGSYSITYSVSNPASDGTVTCSGGVSWLSGFTDSNGTVTFDVAANSGEDLRTGDISVSYSYTDGTATRKVTAKTAVVQYGTAAPSLSVQPNYVTAAAEGQTCSFSYSVRNSVTGGELDCKADVSWISDFDYSVGGTVSFEVSPNLGVGLRTGTITVTYSFGYDDKISKEVTVVQDHPNTRPGGGDISGYIGTYTASGLALGNGVNSLTQTEWTLRIFAYDGSGNTTYDGWCDGIVPWGEGAFEYYGEHIASAGVYIYDDGTIHIPSQITRATLSSDSVNYYLGYTPCTYYTDEGFASDRSYPDLVFTYNESTGSWESDYGIFMAGCTSPMISSMATFFQVVVPTITLTKTADTTSVDENDNRAARHLTEGLGTFTNFRTVE